MASVALKLFESESGHYTLLAIPFFILSSAFLTTGGVANRLIRFAVDCVGHIRGGLAMASVLACMLFAAVSGSSPATVAAIGSIVIGAMARAGYPETFATGVITNAGTLGILIPPSIVMLVYAAAVFVYRDMGPLKNRPWRKKGENIGMAVSRNLVEMALALPKSIFHPEVRHVVLDAAKVSIMLLFIIGNAMLFAHVLTTERIPHMITEVIVGWGLPPWGFLIVVNILLLIAGNFMEPSAILLIMAPILFPIAVQLGIDPIHLGIIMVVNMEIGMITPPVGLNLFVAAGITGRSLTWVLRAALPWLMILLLFLVIVTYVPWISLCLPEFIDQLKGYN